MPKPLLAFLCVWFLLFTLSQAHAITKEEYLKQKAEGQAALAQARAAKINITPEHHGLDYASNFITIELSRTCLEAIKTNYTTACPTYMDLIKYDTTDQRLSGKFFKDGIFFHRGLPFVKNHQIAYPKDKIVVCVDCSSEVLITAKNIMIQASSFTYRSLNDNIIKNFTRYEYSNRMVDACNTVIIAWNQTLLEDTIDYLKSGCTKTNYKEKHQIYMTPHPLTYDGAWYKYKAWLGLAKEQTKQNCVTRQCDSKTETRWK